MDRQLDGDRVLRFPDGDPVKLSADSRPSLMSIIIGALAVMAIGYVVGVLVR